MKKTTVMLHENQYVSLKEKSYKEGLSIGNIIRNAIDAIIIAKPAKNTPIIMDQPKPGQEFYPVPKPKK